MRRLPRYRSGDAETDARIVELIEHLGTDLNQDLVFEMVATAVRLAREDTDRGDLKIANAALKEMRHSFNVFAPYRETRKAAIFGSARTREDDPLYEQTVRLARALAEADWMVITGAGPGIMEAGIEGAGPDNSFGVGIKLPFEAATTQFLADDPKLIVFNYFFTRKVTFIKEADGFVLLPGGFGTLDECFELLTLVQTGKGQVGPIVLLDVPGGTYWEQWRDFVERELDERGYISPGDMNLFRITDDVDVAVAELRDFFSNFHSQRFVDGDLVLRMQRAVTDTRLHELNAQFAHIVSHGEIRRAEASPAERAEADVPDLARLRFRFNRRDHAGLRALIDAINSP